jgi:hypothetical protein
MKKPAIVRRAERVARMCFLGIAIPHQPSLAEGVVGPIRSEKILKFNRTALKNIGKRKVEKVDPRYNGGEDTMIVKVGKPGSRERVEALRSQYEAIAASNEEVSPFWWDDEAMVKAVEDNAMSMEEYNSLPLYRG